MRHLTLASLALCALAAGAAPPAAAQGLLGKLKHKVGAAIDQKSTEAMDKALNAIVCAVTDAACIRKAKAEGKPIKVTDANGKPVSSADSAAAISAALANAAAAAGPLDAADSGAAHAPASGGAPSAPSTEQAPPGSAIWANYDFVPGDRTIWYEDFSGDNVGDFPHRMALVNGNLDVVQVNGHKYLHSAEGGTVVIILPEKLPPRFTVEAHFFAPADNDYLKFRTSDNQDYADWWCTSDAAGVEGGAHMPNSSSTVSDALPGTFVDCRFTIDARYIKGYLNQHRTANDPTTKVFRSDSLFIEFPGGGTVHPTLLTDIRVAEGGKNLYDALARSGHVTTHGILFDSGSDRIRGESTPTLKAIGAMLKAHPGLKLEIEGYTDNVGDAAANRTLSEKRAAAVKQYLVSTFGIAAARLTTKGFGASHPIAPNTTPEGRQTNRRVELVKS